MLTHSKIDKLFPPRRFNDSSVSGMLATREKNIYVIERSEKHADTYKTFDEIFSVYLNKLPGNNIKKYVTNLFNKKLVFIGTSTSSKNDTIFSRIFLPTTKLNGIVLDSNILDIDVSTGETNNIDDCIYATYYGLVRASILTNKDAVSKNKDLHKLLINYIYRIFLRVVGQSAIYNEKQKSFMNMACAYSFYRHFLKQRHPLALSSAKRDFNNIFDKEVISEFLDSMKNISRYDSTKDIPKILIDLNIYHEAPGKIMIKLLEILGNPGMYSLIGGLDQLIAMAILSKYPTNLLSKAALTNQKVHETIEKIVTKYIDGLEYQTTMLLNP